MRRTLLLVLLTAIPLQAQDRTFRGSNRTVLGLGEELTGGLTFADVDGDGDLDCLVANGRHWPQQDEVYFNSGRGRFTVAMDLGERRGTTYALPAGDLDGDGDIDFVTADDMAENLVYRNDGRGRFTCTGPVGPEIEPTRRAQLHDRDMGIAQQQPQGRYQCRRSPRR